MQYRSCDIHPLIAYRLRLEVEHSCRVGRLQVGNACDAGARAGEEGDAEIWRVLGEAPALRQGARHLSESNAASVVLELVPEGRGAMRSGYLGAVVSCLVCCLEAC